MSWDALELILRSYGDDILGLGTEGGAVLRRDQA